MFNFGFEEDGVRGKILAFVFMAVILVFLVSIDKVRGQDISVDCDEIVFSRLCEVGKMHTEDDLGNYVETEFFPTNDDELSGVVLLTYYFVEEGGFSTREVVLLWRVRDGRVVISGAHYFVFGVDGALYRVARDGQVVWPMNN